MKYSTSALLTCSLRLARLSHYSSKRKLCFLYKRKVCPLIHQSLVPDHKDGEQGELQWQQTAHSDLAFGGSLNSRFWLKANTNTDRSRDLSAVVESSK